MMKRVFFKLFCWMLICIVYTEKVLGRFTYFRKGKLLYNKFNISYSSELLLRK